jgi:CRISPR-associated protein Cas5t
MSEISMKIVVPVCSFRRPYAREFLETERVPSPATVYGFLLSLVGEEDRHVHIGTRLALSVTAVPRVSRVLRTAWRVKKSNVGPGIGSNRRPDYQEILTGLECGVWVWKGDLAERLCRVRDDPSSMTRYGGLSLGESRDLVDEVSFDPQWTPSSGRWLFREPQGHYPLPVWVDHVGSKGTHLQQFSVMDAPLTDPPAGDQRWITIEPVRGTPTDK